MLTVLNCSPPAPPLDTLIGVYEWRHEVFVFHGNEPEAVEVTDQWLIESADGDGTSLTISATLTALDGRRCWLNGSITSERRGYVARISAAQEKDPRSCSATLVPTESGLLLSGTDDSCGRVLCSGEGSIVSVVLDRASP